MITDPTPLEMVVMGRVGVCIAFPFYRVLKIL